MNNIISEVERLNLLECVREYGFTVGSEIFWLHKFYNLNSNQCFSRRSFEYELVDILKICSKSTFDKRLAMLNRIKHKLMSGEMKSKLELFTNPNELENHNVPTF